MADPVEVVGSDVEPPPKPDCTGVARAIFTLVAGAQRVGHQDVVQAANAKGRIFESTKSGSVNSRLGNQYSDSLPLFLLLEDWVCGRLSPQASSMARQCPGISSRSAGASPWPCPSPRPARTGSLDPRQDPPFRRADHPLHVDLDLVHHTCPLRVHRPSCASKPASSIETTSRALNWVLSPTTKASWSKGDLLVHPGYGC